MHRTNTSQLVGKWEDAISKKIFWVSRIVGDFACCYETTTEESFRIPVRMLYSHRFARQISSREITTTCTEAHDGKWKKSS